MGYLLPRLHSIEKHIAFALTTRRLAEAGPRRYTYIKLQTSGLADEKIRIPSLAQYIKKNRFCLRQENFTEAGPRRYVSNSPLSANLADESFMEQFSLFPPNVRAELLKLKLRLRLRLRLKELAGHESDQEDGLEPSEAKSMAFSQSQDQVKKVGKKEAQSKRLLTSGLKQATSDSSTPSSALGDRWAI